MGVTLTARFRFENPKIHKLRLRIVIFCSALGFYRLPGGWGEGWVNQNACCAVSWS